MSVIRQVSWEEFTPILGTAHFHQFTSGKPVLVLFVTEWSFPSRLALKKLKKMHFDKTRCGIVDVDLVDSIELVDSLTVDNQQRKITSVPFCLSFREGQQVSHLSGYRAQQLQDMLQVLTSEYKAPKVTQRKQCPAGHQFQKLPSLPEEIYPEGYFFCNQCRRIDSCSPQKLVAHCALCDYDLCVECHNEL